jgi:CTP synthase (UTP-ammonia lyase)
MGFWFWRLGKRGIPGMIRAIQYARAEGAVFRNCLGMQCATLEFAETPAG